MPILEWKWEYFTIDFVTYFPRSQKRNGVIWLIVDRMAKFVNFISSRKVDSVDWFAALCC